MLFLRYRDLNQVWDVVTQAGFFFAPIIYPLGVIPERFHFYLYAWPPTAIDRVLASGADRRRPPTSHRRMRDLALVAFVVAGRSAALVYRAGAAPRVAEYLSSMDVGRACSSRTGGVSKTFRIPSVRRDTVREHVFGLFEPRRFDDCTCSTGQPRAPPGEALGIMGRNGCGKSTLLKVLCGIYAPIPAWSACAPASRPILELGVGWNPELDAIDNVYLIGVGHGADAHGDSRRAWTRFSRLRSWSGSPTCRSSTIRAAWPRGWAMPSHSRAVREVLVLDEIFAVGDAGFKAKCDERYHHLRAAGHTVVLVSHDPRLVKAFCTRAILMEAGRIGEGSAADIAEQYIDITSGSRHTAMNP